MLPTDLAAKLNQCAATNLAGPRDHWFNLLALFTTMVAVGLVFELPELGYELKLIAREWIPYFKYRIITPHERHVQAAKVTAFIGWILIVVGVAGERVAEVKVNDFDVRIQECSDAKVRAATLEAGEAATSAETAHQELNAVNKEATALKIRLGGLDKDIIAQGPRWRLLAASAPELVKQLAPFAGQRVQLYVCGQESSADSETMSTWGDISSILGSDGAKWKVEKGGLVFWNTCNVRQGIGIVVNSRAPKFAMEAAKALSNGLSNTLPPSPEKMLHVIDPDLARSMAARFSKIGSPLDETAPYVVVVDDAGLVIVSIAAHPQQQTNAATKRATKPRKR